MSSPPSPEWQCVGLIVGFIALALALLRCPPQCRRSSVARSCGSRSTRSSGGSTSLFAAWIQNTPVTNRLLRLFGVRRQPADDMTEFFRIREEGTGRIVVDLVQATLLPMGSGGPPPAQRIAIAASFLPASLLIVASSGAS